MHTTVQDRGRFGFQDLGVPVSGALDEVSLAMGNALVGNPSDYAALEILYGGPTLEVMAESARVSLAGTAGAIEIQGEAARRVAAWQSVGLVRGDVFRVGMLPDTACAYLAVEGGFDLEPCLGGLSTYVRSGFGGLEGRVLAAGDTLPLLLPEVEERDELHLSSPPVFSSSAAIRVVMGPQNDYFTDEAIDTFLNSTYTVSQSADRMGMRLDGPALAHRGSFNIVSDAIATGAVQSPGSGQPIVLLADHQTTGGYPKIATVISADLALVGRRRPGDAVRFCAVTREQAEELRREQFECTERYLRAIKNLEPGARLDLDLLYAENLISGVVSGAE